MSVFFHYFWHSVVDVSLFLVVYYILREIFTRLGLFNNLTLMLHLRDDIALRDDHAALRKAHSQFKDAQSKSIQCQQYCNKCNNPYCPNNARMEAQADTQ